MQLTNSLGEVVEFNTEQSKYTGGTSKIFEVDDSTLLKIHIRCNNWKSISPLSESNFDLLKSIKHENFINLIERYHRIPATTAKVEAYTYEHIKGEETNLLFLRTDFIIDQFRGMYQLYEIFTSEGIGVSDVYAANSIVLKDRIVIIDPDFFRMFTNKEELIRRNKNLFIDFIKTYFSLCDTIKRDKLFDGLYKTEDPIKMLEKRLSGYKRPYDYFFK